MSQSNHRKIHPKSLKLCVKQILLKQSSFVKGLIKERSIIILTRKRKKPILKMRLASMSRVFALKKKEMDASFLRFSLSALSFAYFCEFCDFSCAAHSSLLRTFGFFCDLSLKFIPPTNIWKICIDLRLV